MDDLTRTVYNLFLYDRLALLNSIQHKVYKNGSNTLIHGHNWITIYRDYRRNNA